MASLFDIPRYTASPVVSDGSMLGIVELLHRAKAAGLLFPKLWLQLPDETPLRISVAGQRSSTPGFLMLTDGAPFGENRFFGRISPTGQFEIGRDGGEMRDALVDLLTKLAADPAGVAAEFGHLTGHCCFCWLKLSDERSVAVGYGKICAGKFGLPWGAT